MDDAWELETKYSQRKALPMKFSWVSEGDKL